jgi:digeranylgeranylglycerophospholipid reductase
LKNIVIVGAGPAGCYLGQNLKAAGQAAILLEEDERVGEPVKCAGLVGQDVFEKLRIKIPAGSIINTIDGARIHFGDQSLSLMRPGVARVVARDRFDRSLSDGLEVRTGTRFLSLEKKNSGYLLRTDKGDLDADLIIGADGPFSRVRPYVGESRITMLPGYQQTLRADLDLPGNIIQVFFVKPFHEFVWLVPETTGVWRLGAMCRQPKAAVEKIIQDLNIKGQKLKELGGVIPVGYARTVKGNLALLGDAAAQVKPLSGGGLYFGLRSAEILSDCIRRGLLKDYDRLWKKMIGREIRLGLLARRVFDRMSEKDLRLLFEILVQESGKISAGGHFDLHSTAFFSIIQNPLIYRLIWPAVKAGILSLRENT